MVIKKWSNQALELVKKYRFVLIVLLAGIGLMLIPNNKAQPTQETVAEASQFPDQTEALCEILSQIHGAGKVRLLLTVDCGSETVYQMDVESDAEGSTRKNTVTVTDGNRNQQGMVQRVLAPKYRGAVVLCQGAENVEVQLAIVNAVSDATGLTSDRISVLKMK